MVGWMDGGRRRGHCSFIPLLPSPPAPQIPFGRPGSPLLLRSVPFIHIQQSIIFMRRANEGKKESDESAAEGDRREQGRERGREREIREIADGSGIFLSIFFMFLSARI